MNTIEQAREVSQALRSIFINEDVPSVQARKWADTIDALIAESIEAISLIKENAESISKGLAIIEAQSAELASIKTGQESNELVALFKEQP